MPDLPHLILPKAKYDLPRKKHGFGKIPARNYQKHGSNIGQEIENTLNIFKTTPLPKGIDPSLILRIQLDEKSIVAEEEWARNNLYILSNDKNKTLILFSTDNELQEFKSRLQSYSGGPPDGQKNPPYANIFSAIDNVNAILPEDRIGRLLKQDNISSLEHFIDDQIYTLDVELWPIEHKAHLDSQIKQISEYIEQQDGEVNDTYTGVHMVLMRITCKGQTVRELLNIESIEIIDLPPKADIAMEELLTVNITDLDETPSPPDDASALAIIDSGITTSHPLLATAIGEATAIPAELGDGSDLYGHGTKVAGIALYNDVRECIINKRFEPKLKIFSAKVLDDKGDFSDKKLIMSQMKDVISYFHKNYNCRIYNISLGDKRLIYDGGKIGSWATVLDTLSRDLDIVIIVSMGNYYFKHDAGTAPDIVLSSYPKYLFSDDARMNEPATGAIVVSVGSICESEDLPANAMYGPEVQPIAHRNEPSPFTRCGPGIGGAIKPDFCDYGGNNAFDGALQKVRGNISELSSLSLSNQYLKSLFVTSVGTSLAAPRVAHKAAMILNSYPDASSNLIRALLASSAVLPDGSTTRLEGINEQSILNSLGYGQTNHERAVSSDLNRVILFSEDKLEHDNFHIFEVPIVDGFVAEKGKRSITVSLAFNPPVRHTRIDYIGVKMSFRLIRGKSPDEVADAFRKVEKDEDKIDSVGGKYVCPMKPGSTRREGGTLQKATFSMSKNPNDYGDTYYLVVSCVKKWALETDGPQDYSVVVQIEHEANVDLYASIAQRVQPPVRVRV